MPAKSPELIAGVAARAVAIGSEIRERRKSLGVSATAAAEAAGMSRVTLHRVERGEPSVTLGAYLAVLDVLDMAATVHSIAEGDSGGTEKMMEGWLPLRIALADFPQLRRLAWQVQGVEELTPGEAWGFYQRNWRHVDTAALAGKEKQLIDALGQVFGEVGEHV